MRFPRRRKRSFFAADATPTMVVNVIASMPATSANDIRRELLRYNLRVGTKCGKTGLA